jgi:hypothetical protein
MIGMVMSNRLSPAQLDSGSMVCMIKRSTLPPKVSSKTISKTRHVTTLAGKIQTQEVVVLRDLRLEVICV